MEFVIVVVAVVLSLFAGGDSRSRAPRAASGSPDRAENWIQSAVPQVALDVSDTSADASTSDLAFEVSSPNGHVFRTVRRARGGVGVRVCFPDDFSGSGVIDAAGPADYSWSALDAGRVVAGGRFRFSWTSVEVLDDASPPLRATASMVAVSRDSYASVRDRVDDPAVAASGASRRKRDT